MTPQEKAEELIKMFNKVKIFLDIEPSNIETNLKNVDCDANKQCALIAVDEIEKALTDYGNGDSFQLQNMDSEFRYWDKVKQEIEKL